MIEVRKAISNHDRAQCHYMQTEVFSGGENRDAWADHWWIARVDGEAAGFGCLALVKYDDGTFEGYHAISGVLPKFRGKGLQRKLLQRRERAARKLGCLGCISYTARWNWPSANNLIREGYTLYKPRKDWGLPNALYFRKVF
jgi:GNAT superfamily N-acetyltransferase